MRSRSSALIDGVLKVDMGPDSLAQIHRDRLNPTDWQYVLYTHSDDDHFAIRELQYLLPPFVNGRAAKFRLGANSTILRRIATELKGSEGISTFLISSFHPTAIGRYTVTGIRAMHLEQEDAMNLVIDDGTKRMMYATDTGWWKDPTWEYVEAMERPLDLFIVDCAHGNRPCEYCGHLGIDGVLRMRDRLVKAGVLTSDSFGVSTHHGHNGGLNHLELEAILGPEGVMVGYDGLEISL